MFLTALLKSYVIVYIFYTGCNSNLFRNLLISADVETTAPFPKPLGLGCCGITVYCLFLAMHLHYGDLTDSTCLVKIISQVRPSEIYNLGAQSHVKVRIFFLSYVANSVKPWYSDRHWV